MQQIQFIGFTPDELIANIINELKTNLPQQTSQQTDELMTIKETMAFLKASRTTVDKLVRKGVIPRYALDSLYYFKKSDIIDLLVLEKVKT